MLSTKAGMDVGGNVGTEQAHDQETQSACCATVAVGERVHTVDPPQFNAPTTSASWPLTMSAYVSMQYFSTRSAIAAAAEDGGPGQEA